MTSSGAVRPLMSPEKEAAYDALQKAYNLVHFFACAVCPDCAADVPMHDEVFERAGFRHVGGTLGNAPCRARFIHQAMTDLDDERDRYLNPWNQSPRDEAAPRRPPVPVPPEEPLKVRLDGDSAE